MWGHNVQYVFVYSGFIDGTLYFQEAFNNKLLNYFSGHLLHK